MKAHKKNFITAASIASFALIASLVFVWWSSSVLLAEEQERYVENREEIAEIEQRLSLKLDLEEEVQRVDDDIDLITGSLLDMDDVSDFIEDIESIAQQTGNSYNIRNIQEVKGSSSSDVKELNFALDLQGDFASLLSFLHNVKQLQYLTDFDRISINSNAEGNTSTSFTVRVYVR